MLEVAFKEDFLHGYQDQTIEFWFYNRSHTVGNVLGVPFPLQLTMTTGSDFNSGDFTWGLGTRADGEVAFVRRYANGNTDVLTPTSVSLDNWHHLALTWNNTTGVTKMFVNGTMFSVFDRGDPAKISTEYLRIGGTTGQNYDGFIDNIRISNAIRYTANFTPPTTSFTWDSDTSLLLNADSFNNSRASGDDNGGRQALNFSEPVTSTVTVSTTQKKFGNSSLYFPGTSSSSMIGSIYRLNNTALPVELIKWYNDPGWTLEYWFYTTDMDSLTPNDTTVGGGLVGQRWDNVDPGGQWWGFGPRRDGELRFTAFTGPNKNFVTTGAGITANTWHHVAFVFDYNTSISDSTITIYVNGVSKFTQTVGSDGPYIAGDDNTNEIIGFVIGYNGTASGENFKGYVDEVRVSKTARYTAGFTPSTTAFVNDADTVLLLHGEGEVGKRIVRDDNSRIV
jgi:hypothetical protein